MKQTQKYVCTLVEFILVDLDTLLGCARFAEILLSARYCGVCAR